MSSVCFDITAHRNPTAAESCEGSTPRKRLCRTSQACFVSPLPSSSGHLWDTASVYVVGGWGGCGGGKVSKANPKVDWMGIAGIPQQEMREIHLCIIFCWKVQVNPNKECQLKAPLPLSQRSVQGLAQTKEVGVGWPESWLIAFDASVKLLSRSRNSLRTDVRRRPRSLRRRVRCCALK